jgi:hypothetical protein
MSRTRVEILVALVNVPVPDSRLHLNVQDLRPTHASKILLSPGTAEGFSTRRFSAPQNSDHQVGSFVKLSHCLRAFSCSAIAERREVRRLNALRLAGCYIGTLLLKIGCDWRSF